MDPRRRLEHAVSNRRPCGLARREGAWVRAVPCRLEEAGLVVDAPGHGLSAGEEVHLRVEEEAGAAHYEATVLRTSVRVPERGSDGLLLGFLALLTTPRVASVPVRVEVVLPGGFALSLLQAPVRLLDLDIRGLDVEIPLDFSVRFPVQARLYLHLATEAERGHARARVAVAQRGDASVHYRLQVEEVDDLGGYERVIEALRAALAP